MDPFEEAQQQLTRALPLCRVSPSLEARLKRPDNELSAQIRISRDDGSTQRVEGYRVQYSNLLGPYKGGIRFHPHADLSEVRALAFWMTIKCAVAHIPMGGGKGGVMVDPRSLSKKELEALSRGWVRAFYGSLGPDKDVPAPDVGTTAEVMSWMNDEYMKLTGERTGATFTGKPLDRRLPAGRQGSEGRAVATGAGGFYVFDALREALRIPQGATVAIQGMGNVGGNAAKIFHAHGYRIVAMSDSKGGVRSAQGLDPEEVERYKKENGSLRGFPRAKEISNAELLELECDLLIPAALEHQITGKNAGALRAKAVLELANGPTTTEADDILFERGIPVVPDVLANSGGVVVSYFEWGQNLKGEHWSEQEVLEKLRALLEREARNVLDKSYELKTDLRRAAFVLALERLDEALKGKET